MPTPKCNSLPKRLALPPRPSTRLPSCRLSMGCNPAVVAKKRTCTCHTSSSVSSNRRMFMERCDALQRLLSAGVVIITSRSHCVCDDNGRWFMWRAYFFRCTVWLLLNVHLNQWCSRICGAGPRLQRPKNFARPRFEPRTFGLWASVKRGLEMQTYWQ